MLPFRAAAFGGDRTIVVSRPPQVRRKACPGGCSRIYAREMGSDALQEAFDHEQLTVFSDPESGLTGAVAIHSTALGPAMGGLRLASYPGLTDAILDALSLARAMSFKSAAAGLDLGGGKAVVLDDGCWEDRRGERMRAFGRVVEQLGGRYVTAEDVGTTPADMAAIATETDHVAGGPAEVGGRGDPSPHTARTVFGAISSAARLRLGAGSLGGVRVGVQGVGSVGAHLVRMLRGAGAEVCLCDLDPERARAVAVAYDAVALPSFEFVLRDFDVLAPCAMGGAIGPHEVERMGASVIAGGANNPLTDRHLADELMLRGIFYAPDFLANAGGIIHVGAEVLGLDDNRVEALIEAALHRTDDVLQRSIEDGRVPLSVAEEDALARLGRAPERVI